MELKHVLPLLRQNFTIELDHQDEAPSVQSGALACYDRALATTLLSVLIGTTSLAPKPSHSGPKPGSQAAKERAQKAAESRRRNRERDNNESQARLSQIEAAANGGAEPIRG